MSVAIPIRGVLPDELRAVLDFFGVRFDVTYIGNRLFKVALQLRAESEESDIVELSSFSAFSSPGDGGFAGSDFEETNHNRVIPLPYTTSHVSLPKRRCTTVASLLGEPNYFVCEQCFKSFNRRSNMSRHMDRVHCERVVFNCPHCPAVYKHAFHFADHLRGHEDDPQFACENCEKKFTSRNQLRAHKRRNCLEPSGKKHPCASRRSAQYEPQQDSSSSRLDNWKVRTHKLLTCEATIPKKER